MYLNGYKKKRTDYIITEYILLNNPKNGLAAVLQDAGLFIKLFIFLLCHRFRTIT